MFSRGALQATLSSRRQKLNIGGKLPGALFAVDPDGLLVLLRRLVG